MSHSRGQDDVGCRHFRVKVEVCLVLDVPAVAKGDCPWVKGRDLWWQEEVSQQSTDCKV